jgi:hypothetical protein
MCLLASMLSPTGTPVASAGSAPSPSTKKTCCTITGTVTDALTGAVLYGVQLVEATPLNAPYSVVYQAFTDSSGNYSLSVPSEQSYIIFVSTGWGAYGQLVRDTSTVLKWNIPVPDAAWSSFTDSGGSCSIAASGKGFVPKTTVSLYTYVPVNGSLVQQTIASGVPVKGDGSIGGRFAWNCGGLASGTYRLYMDNGTLSSPYQGRIAEGGRFTIP